MTNRDNIKPFVKWVGGKGKLIQTIVENFPRDFDKRHDVTYVEPFVGGGALLFHLLSRYKNITRAVINDINPKLIATYNSVKNNSKELIERLEQLQSEFHSITTQEGRKDYFLVKRELFNNISDNDIECASLFIFLNKTCFNGLYRVNSKGKFNVPFGKYENPLICDKATIVADSAALERVEILCGDFSATESFASDNSLFYFDPPYKPVSATSSFNSYASDGFEDMEQVRLKMFCDSISNKGALVMQSNSSPQCNYFHKLYDNYLIEQVQAVRSINSVGTKRGAVNEILITNYSDINSTQLSFWQ